MDLRQLRYFVAIAEQGGFGSAARKLFVAQPALSRQIGELEAELQIQLFERQRRGVVLTAGGQSFLGDVRKILEELESAKERAILSASGKLGRLNVGLIEYFAWDRAVVDSISRFQTGHPQVTLTLSTAETSLEIREQILRGVLDCGFIFNRPADDANLAGKTVISVGFALAVSSNSPLARLKTSSLSDMANESFIWISREAAPIHYDRLLMMCNQAGFSPRISQYATTETGRLSMVAAGAGCAIVTSAAKSWKPDRVTLITLKDVKLKINLELVWRKDNPSPSLANFVQQVNKRAKSQ